MKFKPKAKRIPRRTDINFEEWRWDTPKVAGWHPLVVLFAEDKPTKKGDDMWVITFGVELPGGEKGRIEWRVPETFPPKVDMLQSVLLAEYEDNDSDFELKPKEIMLRTCAGLLAIDATYQRDDGESSWELVKIMKETDAVAELGDDWRAGVPAAAVAEDDDGDVF